MKTDETKQPQTMRDFFDRADVKAQQEIQKRNPYGTRTHHDAFLKIRRLAFEATGTAEFIGDY